MKPTDSDNSLDWEACLPRPDYQLLQSRAAELSLIEAEADKVRLRQQLKELQASHRKEKLDLIASFRASERAFELETALLRRQLA